MHNILPKTKVKTNTLKVRLTIDVTFELNGEDPAQLLRNMDYIPEMAAGNGLFTADAYEAEVESWTHKIEKLPMFVTRYVLVKNGLYYARDGGWYDHSCSAALFDMDNNMVDSLAATRLAGELGGKLYPVEVEAETE